MKGKRKSQVVSEDEKEASDQEQEEKVYHPIEELQDHGIQHSDIVKLQEAGYYTVEAIAFATRKQLVLVKGITEAKVDRLMNSCDQILNLGFVNSKVILNERKKLVRITSGSKELDKLLGGGFEAGSLTELFGEFRTGKTQICHTLCVTCQLPKENGGGNGKALYIDTEGTFRPEKLEAIAERFGLDPETVISNVAYARAYSSDHQNKLLYQVCGLMAQDNYAILIVDSSTGLYRTDYSGRGELAPRQMHLAKFLRNLQKIADEHKVVVVITNQVVAKVDGMGPANDKSPVGGNIMGHACQTRLSLKKMKGEIRQCKVIDSPSLPESTCEFTITNEGISDVQ